MPKNQINMPSFGEVLFLLYCEHNDGEWPCTCGYCKLYDTLNKEYNGAVLDKERPASLYKRKPSSNPLIEAHQWFKNGDHPSDGPADREGKVVRYFRHPAVDGEAVCKCGSVMHNHGFIDRLGDFGLVCPGDWIINTYGKDDYRNVSEDVFNSKFEKAVQ